MTHIFSHEDRGDIFGIALILQIVNNTKYNTIVLSSSLYYWLGNTNLIYLKLQPVVENTDISNGLWLCVWWGEGGLY